jgi:hypothetical protein
VEAVSTDYNALCFTCKKTMHVGQRTAGSNYSFAYGRGADYGDESAAVAKFIFEHVEHGPVMIVFADDTPSTFTRVDDD